jgi:hypothetical protein
MLRAVGHPVAVNPDAVLARVAREEGWDVLRFDTLGRQVQAGLAILLAALAGTAGSLAARRGATLLPGARRGAVRR